MVRNLTRNQAPGNRLRVRIPCPPLQNNAFPWEYRTSCEFPETSIVSMQLVACRLRRWFSRRDPKIESSFASRFGGKTLGFCIPPSRARVARCRGSGIRTIRAIS